MPNFNLLPLKEKKAIEIEQMRASVVGLSRIVFFILIAMIVSLASIYFYLDKLIGDQKKLVKEREKSAEYKEFKKTKKQFDSLNTRIDEVHDIKNKMTQVLPMMEKLIELIPQQGLYLNSVSIAPAQAVSDSSEDSDSSEGVLDEEPDNSEEDKNESGEKNKDKKDQNSNLKQSWNIEILGISGDRKGVLSLKKSLENSLFFSNIESPIENIIPSEDISFKFTFNYQPK